MAESKEQMIKNMITSKVSPLEEQRSPLDPKDWDEFKNLAYRMIDDMIVYFKTIGDTPTWQAMPADLVNKFKEPLPLNPTKYEAAYEVFKKDILPYSVGNTHPRFWGWVMGSGIPYAMLADMLVSGMNTNVVGYNQAAVKVEEQVIAWFSEIMGFPKDASGVMVSGGSVANHIGVEVALDAKAGFDIRETGLQHIANPMTLYCSTETHSWIDKTAADLGLGRQSLRKIPVDDRFMIDITLLEAAIIKDQQAGLKPFCVIGTVGTVNTGAIDNLIELSRICTKYNLWFHIDGAFGSLVALTTTHKDLINGQQLADSIAFDFHKWMHVPFGNGCILIKDAEAHRKTFSVSPNYLASTSRGIAIDSAKMAGLGMELSRRFNALVVWMSLKTFGVNTFGSLIEKNINQANYLKRIIEKSPSLELLAPVSLNIVCFRFNFKGLDNKQLNQLNKEALLRMQESGVAVPSGTLIRHNFSIRVAILNHRSEYKDFDLFINKLLEHGERLLLEIENNKQSIKSEDKNFLYSYKSTNLKPNNRDHIKKLSEKPDQVISKAKL